MSKGIDEGLFHSSNRAKQGKGAMKFNFKGFWWDREMVQGNWTMISAEAPRLIMSKIPSGQKSSSFFRPKLFTQ
eukprot:scaffold751_cov87-Cylindrotheca_fusiformis.AAC.1